MDTQPCNIYISVMIGCGSWFNHESWGVQISTGACNIHRLNFGG